MEPIFAKLPHKDLPEGYSLYQRIIELDPLPIYERLTGKINPRNRHHYRKEFNSNDITPPLNNGFCDCGCGTKLTGKQRRWANENCATLTYNILCIIRGELDTIRRILAVYYFGDENAKGCTICGGIDLPDILKDRGYGRKSGMELDHIIPVHKGGGGCWLNNYQLICHECHKEKTIQQRKENMDTALASSNTGTTSYLRHCIVCRIYALNNG